MSKFILDGDEPKGFVIDGKPAVKPDKVMATIEEALLQAPIEWIE